MKVYKELYWRWPGSHEIPTRQLFYGLGSEIKKEKEGLTRYEIDNINSSVHITVHSYQAFVSNIVLVTWKTTSITDMFFNN